MAGLFAGRDPTPPSDPRVGRGGFQNLRVESGRVRGSSRSHGSRRFESEDLLHLAGLVEGTLILPDPREVTRPVNRMKKSARVDEARKSGALPAKTMEACTVVPNMRPQI